MVAIVTLLFAIIPHLTGCGMAKLRAADPMPGTSMALSIREQSAHSSGLCRQSCSVFALAGRARLAGAVLAGARACTAPVGALDTQAKSLALILASIARRPRNFKSGCPAIVAVFFFFFFLFFVWPTSRRSRLHGLCEDRFWNFAVLPGAVLARSRLEKTVAAGEGVGCCFDCRDWLAF